MTARIPAMIQSVCRLGSELRASRMITNVSVVDSPESIRWKLEDDALLITAPSVAPNNFAICYRIETDGL